MRRWYTVSLSELVNGEKILVKGSKLIKFEGRCHVGTTVRKDGHSYDAGHKMTEFHEKMGVCFNYNGGIILITDQKYLVFD